MIIEYVPDYLRMQLKSTKGTCDSDDIDLNNV